MKKLISILLLFSYAITLSEELQDLNEPYRSIPVLFPVLNHGWFSDDNRLALDKIFAEINPTTVIEVGSWLGSSAIHMAKLLPEDGKLYAVDTWEGSIEHLLDTQFKAMLPSLYTQFLSNCIHHGVAKKIIPYKMESLKGAVALDGVIADLIYIDASHSEEDAYNDIVAWYPHVRKGGILCGDDWKWPGVKKAVERFAQEVNQTIHLAENFWYFDPKP